MQNNSFNHSVKVPKLYKCAAKISQEVAGGSGSVKQLVYEKTHFNTKALYALVVTTFQKAKEIDLLLKRTKLLEKEPRLDPWLAKILISEVLWGKKQLPKSDAKPIQTILAYEQAFHAHLSDSFGDTAAVNYERHKKPRYVRVNTLINPFNEALELFQDEGWTLQSSKDSNDYESFLKQVSILEGDFMLKDLHLPDVLVFPGGTEFYNHPGYRKGALVLQDKASCLPVHLLSPPPGSVVLDMCAAPGMKTTQLAASLQNQGTVYAVERDPKRFEVLNKMVETSGATCVKTINKDVLECGNSDFPDVEYVLVDPSCSASGMTDRLELQQNPDPSRLQKLAGFQIKILRSAFTRYPKVKKVVYSTCSLYPEENEDVVRQVLETNNQFKLIPADTLINKAWKNFGSPDFGDIGRFCLYARPEEDLTNGFFVAVFERLGEGENNQFFNDRVLNYRKNVEQKLARKEKKIKRRVEEDKTDGKGHSIKENDVEVDGNIDDKDDIDSNNGGRLKKNKKKLKIDDVDTINQDIENDNISKVPKKGKKKKRKDMEDNLELNNDLTGECQTAVTNELLKREKKKKRINTGDETVQTDGQDNVLSDEIVVNSFDKQSLKTDKKRKRQITNDKPVLPTDDQNNELSNDIVGSLNTNEDENTSTKSKKKKRQHKEVEDFEQINNQNEKLSNNTENFTLDPRDRNDEILKKSKKKKNKDNKADNLQQIYGKNDEIIDGVAGQDTESPNQNTMDGKIYESLKKHKKKKIKEMKDENVVEDIGDELTNETSKKSRRKKQKLVIDVHANTTYDKEELLESFSNLLNKSNKKKRKQTDIDATTS